MALSTEDFTRAHTGARLHREICAAGLDDQDEIIAKIRGDIRAYVAVYQTLQGPEEAEAFLRDVMGGIPRKAGKPQLRIVSR